MAGAMKGANKAIAKTNKAINMPKLQETLQQFNMNMAKMDMTEEMMNDSLADAFDDDAMEGEVDDITRQVLDECGVDINAMMAAAPTSKVASAQQTKVAAPAETEAQRMLAELGI